MASGVEKFFQIRTMLRQLGSVPKGRLRSARAALSKTFAEQKSIVVLMAAGRSETGETMRVLIG